MIAALFGGIVVLVVGCALWARAATARADGRSIEGYEQIRNTLGGVSKRSEAAVMNAPSEEVARIHVRIGEDEPSVASSPMVPPAIAPRIHLEPTSSGTALPVFGETEVPAAGGHGPLLRARPHRRRRTGSGSRIGAELISGDGDGARGFPGDQIAAIDNSHPGSVAGTSRRVPKRAIANHRVGIGSLAVVAAVIVGVATWQVSEHHNTDTGSPQVTTHTQHNHGAKQPVIKITAPSVLEPTSITTSVVRFAMPSKRYTLSFSASNTCWIGIEKVVGGPYLWMTTLDANGTGTYQASGSVVVRIGSPPSLEMRANGLPVELPAKNVVPYDATFS